MAIQDKMYEMIEKEIDQTVADGDIGSSSLDLDKVKQVAKMLTELSTDEGEASSLVNQYMAQIKIICK